MLVLLLLGHTATVWANRPASIRLLSSEALPSKPTVHYAPLFVGPETELQWPEGDTDLRLELNRPRVIQLQSGESSFSLYLRPGDVVTIDLKGSSSLAEAAFGSSEADANNRFYWGYQSQFKTSTPLKERISQLPTIDDYEFELFDQAKARKTYVNDYPQRAELSDDFKDFLSLEPKLFYWGRLFAHPVYSSNGGILNIKSIPKVIYEGFDEKLLTQGSLISQEYQHLVRFYTAFATASSNEFQAIELDEYISQFFEASSSLLAGEPLAFAICNILLKNGDNFPASGLREGYDQLRRTDDGAQFAALVEAELSDRMNAKDTAPKRKKKSKAKVKHDVAFFDEAGAAVRLEKYAGKVVYVDFWAGWCGPCRKQFPYTKKMKAEFSDKELKDLVFLYISIDKSEAAWQKAVEQLQLEGEHLFSPGGWRSDACSYFGINSIPRYMILDKEGAIVYPDAPRPSSPETLGILKRLISE